MTNKNNIKELGNNKMTNKNNIKELGYNKMNNLQTNTVKQLTQIARERGLKGYSRLGKAQLINLINTHQTTTNNINNTINN